MPYLRNEPIASDDLDVSQPKLLGNTNASDDSFGIDHYAFSNLGGNTGKHNQLTTPAYVENPATGLPPTTAAAEPKMYAFQDSANVGVINYSRGPSNAVPSPLTSLQSPSTPITLASGATTNVLDFTGLSRCFATLYAVDTTAISTNLLMTLVIWTGSVFSLILLASPQHGSALTAESAGNILRLKYNAAGSISHVYWTLTFQRLS